MDKIQQMIAITNNLMEVRGEIKAGMKYKVAKEIREQCQTLKTLAQELRTEVNDLRKIKVEN